MFETLSSIQTQVTSLVISVTTYTFCFIIKTRKLSLPIESGTEDTQLSQLNERPSSQRFKAITVFQVKSDLAHTAKKTTVKRQNEQFGQLKSLITLTYSAYTQLDSTQYYQLVVRICSSRKSMSKQLSDAEKAVFLRTTV